MKADNTRTSHNTDRFFKILAFVFILLGVVARLIVYCQNRDLFIDEANIARNIFERNFLQLAQPLSYEQYAPPVFLWILKLSTAFGGFSEPVLKLFPLLAGMGSLVMMFLVGKELKLIRSIWYGIGLMAVSYIMLRYGTELKQYVSDVFIVLSLIWLALRTPVNDTPQKKFLITWLVGGTLAIWSSMPSVFVLTGIGCHYLLDAIRQKQRSKIGLVFGTGAFWILQFAVYYFLILKPQIESDYLQNFHQDYFFYLPPDGLEQAKHDWYVFIDIMREAVGFWLPATNVNVGLMIIGFIFFIVRDFSRSLLVLVPLAAVFVAASLKQYSLIPRVSLFMMPLLLLLVCYGIDQLMRQRWVLVQAAGLVFGCIAIYYLSSVRAMAENPFEAEHITKGMEKVMKLPGVFARQVYVNDGAAPAFIYYTQIHPEKSKWAKLRDAHVLAWDYDYTRISEVPDSTIAWLVTNVPPHVEAKRLILKKQRRETILVDEQGSHLFLYTR